MTIAIITHRFVKGSGQGRVNYEIARAALHRGYDVVLLSSEIAPELVSKDAATWVQLPVDGWPTELLRNQIFAWRSSKWLRRHRGELDMVLANGFVTWAPATINAIHLVHNAWKQSPVHIARIRRGPYAWYQWLYTALNAYWEKRAFEQAEVLVAVSEKVRNELTALGIPAERIRIIPNGVDLEEFFPGNADRVSLGLPPEVPLGVFVGDIRIPRKNLETVLKALRDVQGLHLAVLGTAEKSPYPEMAAQLGLNDRVHFLGYRRDVPEVMRAADLCICPSRYESFSLVLLEAMASGLPVVTAPTVGAAQLVDPDCGIVLPHPEDTEALIQGLTVLSEDRARRQRMGQAARDKAKEHSWKRMAQQYLELFEELAASAPSARSMPQSA